MISGAAQSDFGYSRTAKRERLLSHLIYEILKSQVSLHRPVASPSHELECTDAMPDHSRTKLIMEHFMQPGEQQHDIALTHCLWKTDHHSFADAGPKQVEGLYHRSSPTRLGENWVPQETAVARVSLSKLDYKWQ